MTDPKRPLVPDFSDGVDRKLLKQVRDRFLSVNANRLSLASESLSSRHRDVLAILPLLYQINHPLLPGYVSPDGPCGVSAYEPDKNTLSIARTFSQTFKFRLDRRNKAAVHAIFMMGSTGTLAHSESSDVDLWLCIDPELDTEQIELLQKKASKIDAWADGLGLELHTFIMNAEAFREGEAESKVDSESSGSAQRVLLLDEFYRTAILLAGRYPLWWLVPPAEESRYEDSRELLLGKRFVKEQEVLDFGSSANIPKSELIGAGLWQLYKGLDAPYKSVLKLLLAEVYAQELPAAPSLSLEFKVQVYADELEVEQLDPYLMIYRRLENYLLGQNELKRLDLVRKSFYLKVNKKLSQNSNVSRSSWQRKLLTKLVKDWAWPDSKFEYLDQRTHWKIDQVLIERQEVVAELTYSYRFLSNYARANQIASSITVEDLSLLGRKLYAAFQRKAGKIERANPGIASNLWEENLALHHASSQPFMKDDAWLLYRDLASASDASFHPVLKKSTNLVELLVWLFFNGVLNRSTRLSMVPGDRAVSIVEVQNVLAALESEIKLPLPPVPQDRFHKSSYVEKLILFVNVGIDPIAVLSEQGHMRLGDRTDSLAYSSRKHNLIKTIDQVILNSWHELSVYRYEMGETLLQNLQAYLQLCYEQRDAPPLGFKVYCFSSQRADAIAKRVQDLFDHARLAFFETKNARSVRYVVEIESRYHVLSCVDDQFRSIMAANKEHLFELLTQSPGTFSPVIIDSCALTDTKLLRVALRRNKPDIIQVFYFDDGDMRYLIVLDEYGSPLQWALPKESEAVFQASIMRFIYQLIERKQMSGSIQGASAHLSVALYRIVKSARGEFDCESIKKVTSIKAHELSVSVVQREMDQVYDLYLDQKEFSFYDYGERQLQALVHFVQKQPGQTHDNGNQARSIKVIDVNFPSLAQGFSMGAQNETLRSMAVYLEIESKLLALGLRHKS